MGMVVRTNMAGLNANNALNAASKVQQNAMQKLASGFRINKAGDDASGLAISEKMKNQIKALDTASDNCEDGANMIQTAEGYMNETHDILNRMTELAEKSANGVLDQTDRDALQDEMDELCAEIDRMATTANFNGHKLMDGSIGSKGRLELTNTDDGKKINYNFIDKAPKFAGAGGVSFTAGDLTGAIVDDLTESQKEAAKAYGLQLAYDKEAKGADTGVGGQIFYMNTNGDIMAKSDENNAIATANPYDADNTPGGWAEITVTIEEGAADADATVNDGIKLQIGESSTKADKLDVTINSFHTDSLFSGLDGFVNRTNDSTNIGGDVAVKINDSNKASTYLNAKTIDISSQDSASAAADAIRQVSNYVSDERGRLGAQQNRLEHTVNNLTTASENITAANSRIRDTNMAEEMMNYTSKNVIAQAAQAMLAQANSQPQNVLSLLQ